VIFQDLTLVLIFPKLQEIQLFTWFSRPGDCFCLKFPENVNRLRETKTFWNIEEFFKINFPGDYLIRGLVCKKEGI